MTAIEIKWILTNQFVEVPHSADDALAHPVEQQPLQEVPPVVQQPPEDNDGTTLRRSTITKKQTIPNDYVVYLQCDIGAEDDPETFSQGVVLSLKCGIMP